MAESVLRAELQAAWLAGRPAYACVHEAGGLIAIALDMANAEQACAHALRYPRLAAFRKWGHRISMGATHVILFVNVQVEETK